MSQKTALITGITGQDGSYLAELLLEKGYNVVGMVRRTSTINLDRVDHIQNRIRIVQGDLIDLLSLVDILREYKPDEIYNLAAQSFVPTSWQQPILTGEVTALGVTRVLDAIRLVNPDIRFYQASSSEMFGKVRAVPQSEETPFHPRSPYGVAKVYGHWITVNYRESYDMYAVSGILFNHECISARTPLLVRRNGVVDTVAASDLVPLRKKGRSVQQFEVPNLEVWDGSAWTRVRGVTATYRRRAEADHRLLSIQARGGVVEVTAHHHMLTDQHEIRSAEEVKEGDCVALATQLPQPQEWTALTSEMAELLGLLTADGYVPPQGSIQFTNNDLILRERVAELWSRLFLGTAREAVGTSGWDVEKEAGQLYLNGGRSLSIWLREQLYTKDGFKKVPVLILNATREIQDAYLCGYYAGDGLKAGKGMSVKTNSAVLAQGLFWLNATQGQMGSVYAQQRNGRVYYQLNLPSRHRPGEKGQHLHKEPAEVRWIEPVADPTEWVLDLETESQLFMAGVGRIVVHNSPRRGLEFVTRKISHGVARIKLGLDRELRLGNLDAKRDWGFAGDYVEAMWLMLQQDTPDDYVIATGETHTVREFCEIAFNHVDLNYEDHVVVDPAFYRPAEVDLLIGDPSKAAAQLGWEPSVSFPELVTMMVDADLKRLQEGERFPDLSEATSIRVR